MNGENITSGDVEDSLKALISDVREKVYNVRKNELELTINDTLLTQEAQKRKITTNALLEAEVKPKPVTEEQARLFFDQNKERISGDFAQLRHEPFRNRDSPQLGIEPIGTVEILHTHRSSRNRGRPCRQEPPTVLLGV